MSEDGASPVAAFALATVLRKILRKPSGSTTVTITRVTGQLDDEDGDPETLLVTTAEPVIEDTTAIRMARNALIVASVAVTLAASTIVWRVVRREVRMHYR